MFKRKLTALDYHTSDNFDVNDDDQYRNLVIWLEDQKIRHYKIEDRQKLRDTKSSDWVKGYKTYLKDLACPVQTEKRAEQLQWLLSFAVRLEYADNVDKYKNQTSEKIAKSESHTPKVVSTNPLDNLDFDSADFKKGVNTLAQLLSVTRHPDHLITLRAVSKVVCRRLSAEALENPDSVIVKGKPFPFQDADLGFDMGDYVLNQAAKILRLLYIHDLRDLQTRINECIVAVQGITANPKTDTKLGKVGF
ncbi:RNA transcription, translation and transport factor protein [Bacillus rossius redtenbacheri]|uniref:RNA transcription, translation and transport factor protein n=1 Tax=Bacillus rossius redtenbacheri TaxID=93214 RepID=UPI002FDCF4D7